MEWLSDICEGMIINFTSHARGDFYVETVRIGLGDSWIIIPQTAGIDSRGIIAENRRGSALPPGNCGRHSGTHSNWFHCVEHICFFLWRVPTGDLCLKRQVSRDFLCKNSGQGWVRFLFTAAAKKKKKKNCFLPSVPRGAHWWIRWNPLVLKAQVPWHPQPQSSLSPLCSEPGHPPHLSSEKVSELPRDKRAK